MTDPSACQPHPCVRCGAISSHAAGECPSCGAPAGGAPDPIIGRLIGRWRVVRRIGSGGMGGVYLLHHEVLGTSKALKVPLDPGSAAERFAEEARIQAAVGSERVIRVDDVGTFAEDGRPYIMMEYVDGEPVDRSFRRALPPLAEALSIVACVADTLAIAHDKGIIHRDIKPSNIMLIGRGGRRAAVKLLDFGVARATTQFVEGAHAARLMVGTLGYMSPEAAAGLAVDGRADVFSLGVVLYELLTGELPFPVASAAQAFADVLMKPLRPAREVRPPGLEPIPPSVEDCLAHALARRPSERWTMAQLHTALIAELRTMRVQCDDDDVVPTIERPLGPRSEPTMSADMAEVEALIDRYAPEPPPSSGRARPGPPAPRSTERGARPRLRRAAIAIAALAGALLATLAAGGPSSHRIDLGAPESASAAAPPVDGGGEPQQVEELGLAPLEPIPRRLRPSRAADASPSRRTAPITSIAAGKPRLMPAPASPPASPAIAPVESAAPPPAPVDPAWPDPLPDPAPRAPAGLAAPPPGATHPLRVAPDDPDLDSGARRRIRVAPDDPDLDSGAARRRDVPNR